jgi:hypothetical protein
MFKVPQSRVSADNPGRAGTSVGGVGAGLDAGRVAQLRVERDSGPSRGSGYRVTDTAVLTAAHVVADAQCVQVVFNPDLANEWSLPATVELCEPAGDVAVLTIDPPEPRRSVRPTEFGQVGMEDALLNCRAVGFPRFKLRSNPNPAGLDAAVAPFRDVHQADGTISSLSNWREGTLEITVAPPDRDVDLAVSPWEGMSGAAVWCADRIVGVVSRHHRNDGLNRLAAVRTSGWYQQLSFDRLAELCELVGLPSSADQLADVIRRLRGWETELLEQADFEKLQDILFGAPAVPSLRLLYREATQHLRAMPANPDDLFDSVASLRQLVNPTPLFDFLTRFAAAAQDPLTYEELDRWIQQTAPKWQVDLDALEKLSGQLRRTVVLVRLEPDKLGEGWQVTAWMYAGSEGSQLEAPDEPWGREELGELLSGQFATFVDDFDAASGSVQLTVEFLVGVGDLDASLESLTVTIDGTKHEIGAVCPVVVRSLERVREREGTQAWHTKWRELQQRGTSYDASAIYWVEQQGPVQADALRLCAALASPPGADRPAVLRAALAAGTPVVIWHRATRISPRAALERVLGGSGLLDLPRKVMRQRINARHPRARQDHSGRDLVLLWDDPDRVPDDFVWREPPLEGVSP